jgi:hypothetical protein
LQSFTLNTEPVWVILGEPSGTITAWDRSFHWTGLSTATNYYLQVQTSAGAVVFGAWFTSAEAGCEGGTACAGSPVDALRLPMGDYQWRILDYGTSYGYGEWTGFQSFTLNVPPETVVLVDPSGTLTNWDHAFHWTGLTIATYYYLEVQNSEGATVLAQWYTSAEAGCTTGTACVASPSQALTLPNGDYKWRILDYGTYGYGNWTELINFTLNLP